VLAQAGRRGHVVVIEGDDAVDVVAAGQPADGVGDVGLGLQVGHVVMHGDVAPRPLAAAEALIGDEDNARALPGALLDEGQALEFAGETEDGDGALVRHGTTPGWKKNPQIAQILTTGR